MNDEYENPYDSTKFCNSLSFVISVVNKALIALMYVIKSEFSLKRFNNFLKNQNRLT